MTHCGWSLIQHHSRYCLMIEEESCRSPYRVRLKLHTFGPGAILQSLPRLFYANGFFSGGCLSAKTTHSDMTWHRMRRAARAPLLSSEVHQRAHEIALAEIDPAMAQDVIRGCAVEIEVRQDEVLQQPLSRELALVGAELDGGVLVLGAVHLRRLEGFAIVDRLGEAGLG